MKMSVEFHALSVTEFGKINKELVFKKRLRVGLENMIYPLRWDGRVLWKGIVIICVNKNTSNLATKY